MSLAALVGIILNAFLKGEEKPVAKLIEEDTRNVRQDMNKLKNDIKEELTVELKEDIIKAIKQEMNKQQKTKRK